jgi:N6-L-threonylcarbamoyladenine synthase
MKVLGIESSCDETAVAIVDERLRVLANVVSSQIDIHRVTQGVVPEVAARTHTERILPTLEACLGKAKLTLDDIDGIAVTYGPGLITSLLVGLETAKALAFATGKPLLGVNHIEGHVLSNLLEQPVSEKSKRALTFDKKRLPIVVLTVSGGHTELLLLKKIGQYKLLGRTRDDAAGEAFDKVAKLLGLPYPGGPAISKVAEQGLPNRYPFPRPMLGMDNYDFSFAGLKTAVWREVASMSSKQRKAATSDIAASFQQAVVDTLLGKAGRAISEFKARELWIVGGVAANTLLRHQARDVARSKKVQLRIPSFELCTDNAVMIAAVGVSRLAKGKKDAIASLKADPNLDLITVR